MKRFSEFAETINLDGDKVRIEDILDKEIIITAFNVSSSKFPNKGSDKCAKVQFHIENDINHIFFTGSNVLIDALERYKSEIPFITTIKKIDKYYSFT